MTLIRQEALKVASRLREAGHTVLYAGGCVRDRLRGIEAKDIDLVTSASPDQVLQVFPKGNSIGAHFGVILVRQGGVAFEIATFREDGNYHDGRHPEAVCFSTPEKDAQRRDFTINGLFEDPWTGEVIDYVGGIADLNACIIRAIGDAEKRFDEDSLRLMRAIRFATVTGFALEEKTWAALCRHASWLSRVSMERIREELMKILCAPRRAEGVDMLVKSGLMKQIIPEVYEMIGCEQPPQWHPEGDVYTHTLIMLRMLEDNPTPELALATLLHDIGKPSTFALDETGRIRFNSHDSVGGEMTRCILNRLKCSNQTIERTVEMVDNHMKFMAVQQMREARLRRFMDRPTFGEEMELHRVDCASSNGFTDNYEFLQEKQEAWKNEPIVPPPLVNGRDLLDLGERPSPQFKVWLEAVQIEQLEQRIKTREAALDFLRQLVEEAHGTSSLS